MGSAKNTPREEKKKAKSSSKSSSKPTTKTQVAKSPQTFKSTEFIAESDNEKDEPIETNSSSDSDNDSLPSNPAVKSPPKSKSKPNGKLAESSDSSEAESGEESESGSSSGEEEEEESDAESESNTNGNKSAIPPPSKKDARTVSLKVAPFKPPPGFEKNSSKNSSKASQLFNKSNLEGKEIWYITAPASVPIASVKEISLQDAKLGKAVFSQDGNDYGFVHDPLDDMTYTKILLPSNSKDGYSIEKKPVNQIYHMQQVVNLSKTNSSQATVPAKRPVRQQPKGLKARYQPIGFASAPGIIGSDDESDSEERAPKFQKIAMSEDENSDVEMEDAPPAATPAKKSKSDKSKKTQKDSEEGADRSSKKKHKESGDKKKKHKSSFTPISPGTQELKFLKKQTVTELAKQSIPLRIRTNSPSDLDPETTTNTRASQLCIPPPNKTLNSSSNSDTTLSNSQPTKFNSTMKSLFSDPESAKKKATEVVSTEGPGVTTKNEARREKKAQKEAKRRRLESRTDNF